MYNPEDDPEEEPGQEPEPEPEDQRPDEHSIEAQGLPILIEPKRPYMPEEV